LAERKLTLRNPHPWNLLFDGRQFSYANAGSIVPLEADTFIKSYEKLARFFVRPLLLVENGFEHIARKLTEDARCGVLPEDIAYLQCDWAIQPPESRYEIVLPCLHQLAARIEALQCKSSGQRWSDYFATDCDFRPGTSWTRKQDVLATLLADPDICSVLDLGANTGHYARQAASSGREVIATDFDPALVDSLFQVTQNSEVPLYPAVLDFTHPTPGQGVDNCWFPPATERWKADLVLCFALTHHMVFGKYRLDFEQVACGINSFTTKSALVEYVPPRVTTREWRPDAEGWYSVDNLAAALRRRFPFVEVLAPAKDGRQLLVCGSKRTSL
jgi:SAM-dependent methyltransferase